MNRYDQLVNQIINKTYLTESTSFSKEVEIGFDDLNSKGLGRPTVVETNDKVYIVNGTLTVDVETDYDPGEPGTSMGKSMMVRPETADVSVTYINIEDDGQTVYEAYMDDSNRQVKVDKLKNDDVIRQAILDMVNRVESDIKDNPEAYGPEEAPSYDPAKDEYEERDEL